MTKEADHLPEMPIYLDASPSRRIHAGLSWSPLYEGGESEKFSSQDMAESRVINFPVFRTLLLFAGFLLTAIAVYQGAVPGRVLSLYDPFLWVVVIAAAAAFGLMIYVLMSNPNMVFFQGKTRNRAGRDHDHAHFDLDLHCMVYDAERNFLFEINPTPEKLISADGSVYHSSEDSDGRNSGENEMIHIETAKASAVARFYAFCVSNDCRYDFDKISGAKIRLADTACDATLIEVPITSAEADGFCFCIVENRSGEWTCRPINRYLKFADGWQNSVAGLIA